MALIKCPECGRENVSDSAEACPDCGYGIKAHFEKISVEQQRKETYKRKLQSVIVPKKPKRMNLAYWFAIFFAVSALGGFLMSPIIGLILIAFVCWMCYMGSKQYKEELEKYNLAKSDFEKYRQEVVKEQERQAKIEAAKPKCPQCASTNLEKISTTDRAMSIAIAGAASGKIGKQYKCRNCKYMW